MFSYDTSLVKTHFCVEVLNWVQTIYDTFLCQFDTQIVVLSTYPTPRSQSENYINTINFLYLFRILDNEVSTIG